MALIDFTSYDDVRAALGVSADEIEDSTLSLNLYEFNLVSELESVDLTLADQFLTLQAAPTPWTVKQTRFHQSVILFATYAVAKHATVSLPMFAPKEETDGKASVVRFAQDPYKATIARVDQQYTLFKAKAASALNELNSSDAPTTTARFYVVSVSPTSDPVLGT